MAELKVDFRDRNKKPVDHARKETAPDKPIPTDKEPSPELPTVPGEQPKTSRADVKLVSPALAAYVRPERGGHVINVKLPTELKVRVDKMYTELRVPRNKICLVALEEFLKTNGY